MPPRIVTLTPAALAAGVRAGRGRVAIIVDPTEPPRPRVITNRHHIAYNDVPARSEMARRLNHRARAIVGADPFTGYFPT